MGVGGQYQSLARAGGRQHRPIIAPAQPRVVKGPTKKFADELDHRTTTAAMGEVHAAMAQVEGAETGLFHLRVAPPG